MFPPTGWKRCRHKSRSLWSALNQSAKKRDQSDDGDDDDDGDDGDDGDVHNHDDGVAGVIIGVSDWLRGYTASPAGGVSSQTLQMEKSLLRSAGDDDDVIVEVFWQDER